MLGRRLKKGPGPKPNATQPVGGWRCQGGSALAYARGVSKPGGLPRSMAFTPMALQLMVRLLAA